MYKLGLPGVLYFLAAPVLIFGGCSNLSKKIDIEHSNKTVADSIRLPADAHSQATKRQELSEFEKELKLEKKENFDLAIVRNYERAGVIVSTGAKKGFVIKRQWRDPVPGQRLGVARACGDLFYTEDTRSARDNDDVYQYFKVDCGSLGLPTIRDSYFIRLAPGAIRTGPKGTQGGQMSHLTHWRREAVRRTGSRNSVPYLCFEVTLAAPLCQGENWFQTSPELRRVTANPKYMSRW